MYNLVFHNEREKPGAKIIDVVFLGNFDCPYVSATKIELVDW